MITNTIIVVLFSTLVSWGIPSVLKVTNNDFRTIQVELKRLIFNCFLSEINSCICCHPPFDHMLLVHSYALVQPWSNWYSSNIIAGVWFSHKTINKISATPRCYKEKHRPRRIGYTNWGLESTFALPWGVRSHQHQPRKGKFVHVNRKSCVHHTSLLEEVWWCLHETFLWGTSS